MNKTILFLTVLFILTTSVAIAEDEPCSSKTTSYEMKECYNNEFVKADKELNTVYQELLKKDEKHKKQLIKTELNWIKWKNYECEYQSLAFEGGTLQPLMAQICLTNLTVERIKHIKDRLNAL